MKFNIYMAGIIYGGGTSAPEYKLIHEGVSEDFIRGFFQNIPLIKRFETEPDSMGCYKKYKIEVESL